jgi:hypothetical protein
MENEIKMTETAFDRLLLICIGVTAWLSSQLSFLCLKHYMYQDMDWITCFIPSILFGMLLLLFIVGMIIALQAMVFCAVTIVKDVTSGRNGSNSTKTDK